VRRRITCKASDTSADEAIARIPNRNRTPFLRQPSGRTGQRLQRPGQRMRELFLVAEYEARVVPLRAFSSCVASLSDGTSGEQLVPARGTLPTPRLSAKVARPRA